MFGKIINLLEKNPQIQKEMADYESFKIACLTPPVSFQSRTGIPVFVLAACYPVTNEVFTDRLLDVQKEVKAILGENEYYPDKSELHMSCMSFVDQPDELSDTEKNRYRENAKHLFAETKNMFPNPDMYFRGGFAGKDAVAVLGYNFAELNTARVEVAREGFRSYEMKKGQRMPIGFDKITALRQAMSILERGVIVQSIAHISLARFYQQPTIKQREAINELLSVQDFGRPEFSKIGLYEYTRCAIFSRENELAFRRLPAIENSIWEAENPHEE